MYNPTRRNRNIGTAKQGAGQNNKLVIPGSTVLARKSFYERIGNHKKIHKNIKGNEFVFIVEETRKTSEHACTVNDVVILLNEIPPQDLGELKYVIFRQPKRKEEILSPVWGRLIYSYDYENEYYPAIILDAIDYEKKFKWKKKLSIEDQKEISRLQQDGHKIIDNGKYYLADYELEYIRNTQLYRTLLHEIGHYVHYLNVVEKTALEEEENELWERRFEAYFKIPVIEKEKFAHYYADELKARLLAQKVIPFDRK